LNGLKALPAHTVDVAFQGPGGVQNQRLTGALLNDIANAAGPRYDANRKNDLLRWSARVHATDNYEVIVAFGEFAPNFENKQSWSPMPRMASRLPTVALHGWSSPAMRAAVATSATSI